MKYTEAQLDIIYRRTTGYCHICHKKLSRKNYANFGERGAWEVDHSNPRVNGGTNHGNNLFAACVSCNRRKCKNSTPTARSSNGKTRAPLCPEKRKNAQLQNGILGAMAGGVCGAIFGPGGAVVGSLIGGYLGGNENPDKC